MSNPKKPIKSSPLRPLTLKELVLRTVLVRLRMHHYNRTYTAESLGITLKKLRSLITEIKSLGIKVEDSIRLTYNPPSLYDWKQPADELE